MATYLYTFEPVCVCAVSVALATWYSCFSVPNFQLWTINSQRASPSACARIAAATPASSFDNVTAQPSAFNSAALLAINTGRPANSSISRSFQLSPIAMISSRRIPRRRAHSASAAPFAHPRHRADEHYLNRIFVEALFQRHAFGDEFAVALVISAADRILPINALENQLTLAHAVKN